MGELIASYQLCNLCTCGDTYRNSHVSASGPTDDTNWNGDPAIWDKAAHDQTTAHFNNGRQCLKTLLTSGREVVLESENRGCQN